MFLRNNLFSTLSKLSSLLLGICSMVILVLWQSASLGFIHVAHFVFVPSVSLSIILHVMCLVALLCIGGVGWWCFSVFSLSFQFQPKPKNEDHDTEEPQLTDQIKDEYVKPVEDDGKHITIQ